MHVKYQRKIYPEMRPFQNDFSKFEIITCMIWMNYRNNQLENLEAVKAA